MARLGDRKADQTFIAVEHPSDPDDPEAVYSTLTSIVAQTLAFDPHVIPVAARHLIPHHLRSPSISSLASRQTQSLPIIVAEPATPVLSDPDDFAIYTLDEAEHIAYAIEQAFEIELASEVILAAANVGKLANSIVAARRLLRPTSLHQE